MVGIIADAKVENLSALGLDLEPGTPVDSDELLRLAKACPRLRTLLIPNYYDEWNPQLPTMEDLGDDVLEEILRNMPDLKDLYQIFELGVLTEQALITLATYCSKLTMCQLSASIDFEELVRLAPPLPWPRLWQLHITMSESSDLGRDFPFDATDDVDGTAERLCELMPKLRMVDFHTDEDLTEAMKKRTWAAFHKDHVLTTMKSETTM